MKNLSKLLVLSPSAQKQKEQSSKKKTNEKKICKSANVSPE